MSEQEFNWQELENEFASVDKREFEHLDSIAQPTRDELLAVLEAEWEDTHADPDHYCSDPEACREESAEFMEKEVDSMLEAIEAYGLKIEVDSLEPDSERGGGVGDEALFTIKIKAKGLRPLANWARDGLMMMKMRTSLMESMLGPIPEGDLEAQEAKAGVEEALELVSEVLELISYVGRLKLKGV